MLGASARVADRARRRVRLGGSVQPSSTCRRKHLLPHAGQIMPCVAPSTVMCSECDVSDSNGEHALMKREAVAFNGNVLVPLSGLDKVNGAWFTFQRFPHGREPDSGHRSLAGVSSREHRQGVRLVTWIWRDRSWAITSGSACGSLFEAIPNSDVAEQFTSFAATARHFRSKAEKLEFNSIARELGSKWPRWPQQIALYNRWGAPARCRRTTSTRPCSRW